MSRVILAAIGSILILSSSFLCAQEIVTKPITELFEAMRAHQGAVLKAQFTPNALLQRVNSDGTIKTNDIEGFATAISSSTKMLDEKLLKIKTHRSGNLASVWAPYVFYVDGKLSHCGVNSFQLIQIDDVWKIHYLIDNMFSGDCSAFVASHKTT